MLCGRVHEDHAATIRPEPGGHLIEVSGSSRRSAAGSIAAAFGRTTFGSSRRSPAAVPLEPPLACTPYAGIADPCTAGLRIDLSAGPYTIRQGQTSDKRRANRWVYGVDRLA
jgi:hypothetical protein